MPKRMLPRSLSDLISRVRSKCVGNRYPQTAAALEQLEIAVGSECKLKFIKRAVSRKSLQNKIHYLSNKARALDTQVQSFTSVKTSTGRVTREWMLKVFLASPHASGRALADSFRLVAGFGNSTISRLSILKIKAAWVDMYVRMLKSNARDTVAAHLRSCRRNNQPFL